MFTGSTVQVFSTEKPARGVLSNHPCVRVQACSPQLPRNYCTLCCRHVILPKDIAALVPKDKLMSETEWRKIGVQQSRGWVHYMFHKPGTFFLTFQIASQVERPYLATAYIILLLRWVLYSTEPHILLFRRPVTGK